MRRAILLVAVGCRIGFDEGAFGPIDAPVDAISCTAPGVDWANWPIPNDPGSGRPHLASYAATDTAVTDLVTTLVWQRDPAPGTYTWDQAKAYCATLTLDGACWRLPQRIELVSIVDYSHFDPPLDPLTVFRNTPKEPFWTATQAAGAPAQAWFVEFVLGQTGHLPTTELHRVRCVRVAADPPVPRYLVASAETVLDVATGLEWRRTPSATSFDFSGAQSYCGQLATGWRVPSVQELQSLVDTSQTLIMIDPIVFPNTPASMFWTVTDNASDAAAGWTVDFNYGYATRNKTVTLPVRCVR